MTALRKVSGFAGHSTDVESILRQSFAADRRRPDMDAGDPRDHLAQRIAGEIVLSDDPGATMRKWRNDFEVSQTQLAEEIDVSSSVISDYESGRRESPGIGVIRRLVEGLLAVDERRGGERVRQFARILSAGFDESIVLDLREYQTTMALGAFYDAIGAEEMAPGTSDRIYGHTVIDSIEAITRLSSEDFYRLYGQSTERALVFTKVTRGESPLVAMRVASPKPAAIVLHGLEPDDLWELAPDLARMDGVSLAVTNEPLTGLLDAIRGVAE